MSFIRIPLYFGRLNVKRTRHLRRDERQREVPVWRVGSFCVVWRPSDKDSAKREDKP